MENTTNIHDRGGESELDQDLSFGDLPSFLHKEPERSTTLCTSHDHNKEQINSSSTQDFFEFSPPDQNSNTDVPTQDIIFFGKRIPHKTEQANNKSNPSVDPPHSRNLFSRSARMLSRTRRPHSMNIETRNPTLPPRPSKSFNDRYPGNSKKHKFWIGLVKIPSKMELKDMKKRQSRQTPAPMVPASLLVADEKPFVGSNGSGGKKGRGELAEPLKCRSMVAGCLAKACFKGCVPLL